MFQQPEVHETCSDKGNSPEWLSAVWWSWFVTVWSASLWSGIHIRTPFPACLKKKGFDRHYKSVKRAASLHRCTASAAIICLKCGADFHYTACIPGIPGQQGWITGKPEWGGLSAMMGGRKGTSLEWEYLSGLQEGFLRNRLLRQPHPDLPERVYLELSRTISSVARQYQATRGPARFSCNIFKLPTLWWTWISSGWIISTTNETLSWEKR